MSVTGRDLMSDMSQVDQENESSSPLITPAPLHKLGSFKNAPKSGNFSVCQLSMYCNHLYIGCMRLSSLVAVHVLEVKMHSTGYLTRAKC